MRHVVLCASLAVALGGCGGSPSAPSGGTGPTITISASGVSPSELTVSQGARVLFVNNDTRAHNMASDCHPDHSQCPELNTVGLLQPGQSRETGNMVTARTCGFHDHDDPPAVPCGSNKWTGHITVR